MNRFTTLLFLGGLMLLAVIGCQKDDIAPSLSNFTVNNLEVTAGSGDHALGETVSFEMDASDDSGLDRFVVTDETDGSNVVYSEDVSGSVAVLKYDFLVNADAYVPGDSIYLNFAIEDEIGNFDAILYRITVAQ